MIRPMSSSPNRNPNAEKIGSKELDDEAKELEVSSPDKKRPKTDDDAASTSTSIGSSSKRAIVPKSRDADSAAAPIIPFWVAGSSPVKLLSLDELIKMNDSISKMSIVHKIATDPNCKVEDLVTPCDSLHQKVKANMHRAYWDLLGEDLAKNPPNYERAFSLLIDLKEMLDEHVEKVNLKNARSAISEILDIAHLRSTLNQGTLNFQYVLKAVLGVMERLCAPIRDEIVAKLKNETNLVKLFSGIFNLAEMMQVDLANFTLSQNRQLISTYSVQIEYDEFMKLMDIDQNAAKNTKEWLRGILSEFLSNASDRHVSLSRSDVNELIIRFYLTLLTTNPMDRIDFPETVKLDEKPIEAIGEKFLQLELVIAAIFICSNLVGKSICEGTPFKAELKRDLIVILNDVDWKNYVYKLENVCLQCEQRSKEFNKEWNVDRSQLLKQNMNGLRNMDNPVRALVRKRMCEFVAQVLRQTGESLQIPSGMNTVQAELASMTSRFYAIAVHNWNVFGRFYAKMLDDLYEETRPQQE